MHVCMQKLNWIVINDIIAYMYKAFKLKLHNYLGKYLYGLILLESMAKKIVFSQRSMDQGEKKLQNIK